MNHRRLYTNPFVTDQNDAAEDEAKSVTEPSPKKSKRSVQKRVVSVQIGDVDGSKSRGESHPPSDSWAWRKYGQKPIKGSPFPRGYYRCSTSKSCPARKQVERCCVDPTTLVITYAGDHNHAAPAAKHNPPSASVNVAATTPSPTTSSSPSKLTFTQLDDDSPIISSSEFGWLSCDVTSTSTSLLHSPLCAASEDDVSLVVLSAREDEEESFFADLGELPEYSVVFRRGVVEPHAQDRRCSLSAISCIDSTG